MTEDYVIKYDDQMLNEMQEIMSTFGDILSCQGYIQKLISEQDVTYQGEATELLHEYYTALNAHLTALQVFYSIAIEFMVNCFLEIHSVDELMEGFY